MHIPVISDELQAEAVGAEAVFVILGSLRTCPIKISFSEGIDECHRRLTHLSALGEDFVERWILAEVLTHVHLLIRLPWEVEEFYPESASKFFRKDFDAQFAFFRNGEGEVDQLVYYFRGSANPPFRKLDSEVSEQAEVAEILGEYHSPELRTSYRLMINDDHLILWHLQNEEVALLRLDRDRYLGDRWWCEEIDVVRDANDQVTGFTLTADGGNVQKLRFVKL